MGNPVNPNCGVCQKMFDEVSAYVRDNDEEAIVRFLTTDHEHECSTAKTRDDTDPG